MIRKSALAATIVALLNPVVAGALGLGNIEVSSALNEPLKARIPLSGVSPAGIDDLKAALASQEQFSRAGLERIFVLSNLRFKIVQDGATRGHIDVTSQDPITEPFLNFLVDLNWANGRVLREYTILLDPPVYGAAIRSATDRRVETVARLPVTAPAPMQSQSPITSATVQSARVTPAMAPVSAAPSGLTGDAYGPVQDGETLWSIADKIRPVGTSIQSMMLALLRANPQAFSIDNVNALMSGAVLRIPAASEVRDDKAQAMVEVARQHGLWDEYRQSIAASVQPQADGAAAPSAASAMSAAGNTDAAPKGEAAVGADSAGAELKLVGSGTTGAIGADGVGDVQALRDELSMAQEEATAAKSENQELKSRLSEVEGLVGDMKRLVELRDEQLAALQNQMTQAGNTEQPMVADSGTSEQTSTAEPSAATTPQPGAAPESQPAAAEASPEPATQPVAQTPVTPPPVVTKPVPMPTPAPASFIDEIQAMVPVPLWTVLAGIGVFLLGFGGLRMARARKQGGAAAADDGMVPGVAAGGSLIEQYARTELPAGADDGVVADDDATQMPSTPSPDAETLVNDTDPDLVSTATSEPLAADSGEEDPLAEVNVYLAYERFDQAEQLVRDAIETYPQRTEYRLKLLEVFYAAKNAPSFETAAEELQTAVGADNELMSQAHAWWTELGTGRALFSADDGPGTAEEDIASAADADDDDLFDVTSAESSESSGVDFDLGFEDLGTAAAAGDSDLDFNLDADDEPVVPSDETPVSADEPVVAADDNSLDFDLGGFGEPEAATAGAEGNDDGEALDFDLGFADADEEQGAPVSLTDDAATAGLATLDDADAAAAERSPLPAHSDDDSGLDLDFELDDGTQFDLDQNGDEQASIDLSEKETSLDFNLGDTTGLTQGDADGSTAAAASESELDFDLGETSPLQSAAGSSAVAADSESELDFDLGDTNSGDGLVLDEATDGDSTAEAALGMELEIGGDVGNDEEGLSLDMGTSTDGESSGLDFDLGDTGTASAQDDSAADDGLDMGLQLDDSGADDDVPLTLDMDDADVGSDASSQTLFQDAMTEVSDSDLALDLDDEAAAGDETAAIGDAMPVLDMDMGEDEDDLSIDTVKLSAEAAQDLRGPADDATGGESEFGMDTEFRGIFADDGDEAAADSSDDVSASALDFDLGTDLDDVGDGSLTEAAMADLEQTQFSLRDVSSPGGDDDDDENHTLVLGRGASGEVDELQTKLDLAQAYLDMGDNEGARNLLGEVMADGGEEQQQQARVMLTKLS